MLKTLLFAFVAFFALPLAVHGTLHWSNGWAHDWRTANWTSTNQLVPAGENGSALVRIYSARTGRWRGIFAVHSWIVLKDAAAADYERFDKVGWGSPIRVNGYAPDARWFGHEPQIVFAADGEVAEELIPKIRAAIESYAFQQRGDYRAWPGPNSNTFVAAVMAAVPEIRAVLPSTAIGKDYPHDGRWLSLTPSGSGARVTLGGYLGITIGWLEGLEINILGAVAGLDIRRPAIKLPGFGRIGMGS